MTRADVVRSARDWLGTAFVHQASVRGSGCDCIGLIGGIARDAGTPEGIAWARDLRFHAYARTPDPRTLLEGVATYLDRIAIAMAEAGDVLLMYFEQEPQHFALLVSVDPAYIVHASFRRGRVVEHRMDDRWRSRVMRAYRYRGIA